VNREVCWITWEDHRRSIELAKELGAQYYFIESNETFILRHLLKAIKSVSLIYRYRKGLVIVQNPSRVLAALAALLKLIFRFPLVVDRHTNFRLGKGLSMNPAIWFVILCSEFSLRVADLTIVTNDFLKEIVEKKGGRALVLHDKIPVIKRSEILLDLPNGNNVLFVCSYAPDEPFKEVISAARYLPQDCHIHITGDYRKVGIDPKSEDLPGNVHPLGFISKENYDAYLLSCDVVMVLTTSEWVIVCGGYEAAAAQKPLITSKTDTLVKFWRGNAYHAAPTEESIVKAVIEVTKNAELYQQKMREFVDYENEIWRKQWSNFYEKILTL
jgi:hypothetical protein